MPLFAKFLVILNILATGGFVYLAGLDYSVRQAWSQAVFQHELAIDGLPLDRTDPGRNITQPQADDLGDDDSPGFLGDLFKAAGAGKPVVKTQERELERVRAALLKEFAELPEAQRRQRIRDLLLAQAQTYADRLAVLKQARDPDATTEQLQKLLMGKFDEAVAADRDLAAKRRAVAHLLYNLDPNLESHQRLTVIVGLKAYVREAAEQARALREIADSTRFEAGEDRRLFEDAYQRNRDRIVDLMLQLDRQQSDHVAKQRLVQRIEEEIIKPQAARIEELNAEKTKVKAMADDLLKQQAELENELFVLHRQMSDLLEKNLQREREIRDRELGRNRGGRQ